MTASSGGRPEVAAGGRRLGHPALAERDRLLDAARTSALLVVVLAHSLAWDVGTGEPRSVLDLRPDIAWATWLGQILPLFFAAGAVANAGSYRRDPVGFLPRRMLRLATPALVYTVFWTAILLPTALFVPQAELVGRYLSQLVWFLGVYSAVVVAVPLTLRWTASPVRTLALWLVVIGLVDLLRWQVAAWLGWLNLFLVWGFLHQVGYHLPVLRRARALPTLAGALAAGGAAVALAVFGPYSSSMVTYLQDPEPSNLSPPTVVVALYGLGQVLLLAAAARPLEAILTRDGIYLPVALLGARGVGIYLWHAPLVGLFAGAAWAAGFAAAPLGSTWVLVHLAGFVSVLAGAWFLAGAAGRVERAVRARLTRSRRRSVGPPAQVWVAISVPVALLLVQTTGFGTWWGKGVFGIPSSSVLAVVLLGVALRILGAASGRAREPSPDAAPSAV